MKITPLRIISSEFPEGFGTGRRNGQEVLPYTKIASDKVSEGIDLLPTPAPLPEDKVQPEILENLRDYQKEDVLLLSNRAVGLILSEPRTGKTPTAISIFRAKGVDKYLVVCPTSIILQWVGEIEKWGQIKAQNISGTKKQRLKQYEKWTEGAMVVGYESFRNDYKDFLQFMDGVDGIILDESHRINNRKTLQYKAVAYVSKKIPNRLLLTGTLAPNKMHEIFGTLSVAYPDIFTGYWRFVDYYFHQEEKKIWSKGITHIEIGDLKHPTELQEFLERVAVNRTQKEVMPWLPPKDYVQIKLPPSKQQLKYIKDLEDMFEIEDTDVIVQGVLDQAIRIRQILNAPKLLDLDGKSPKTEWIRQYLKDYPDTPVVIFSSFTSYLELLSEDLEIPHLITGKVDSKQRNKLKNDFQSGKINVLLINIQAGKEGLTLDRGHAAIFCDNYPPAADIFQAENRITATTSERANKPNTIYQLMMKGQYDEDLYELVKNNGTEIDAVNKYKEYLERSRK